jgi:serine phosphatase RsbU (regulator of sigma subunit)
MEKTYEQLLDENRQLRADNKELKSEYEKLGKMYDELSLSYEDALLLYDRAKESIRIESELRVARNIQMSMVPHQFPTNEGVDLNALMVPAKEVGGDLYDFFIMNKKLYFCIGDVSGKGIPASLFMAVTRNLYRHVAKQGMMPDFIANQINASLTQFNENNMFVTLFIGILDLVTGHLDFCNCGHNPPIINGKFYETKYHNLPLGVWDDYVFHSESIDSIGNSQLLVYTDGLNEAEDPVQNIFGDKRLMELMEQVSNKTSKETIETLQQTIEDYRDGADPNDDLTMMCMRLERKI